MAEARKMSLFKLPEDVLLHSLSHLTFKEIFQNFGISTAGRNCLGLVLAQFQQLTPAQKLVYAHRDEIAAFLAIRNTEFRNFLSGQKSTFVELCRKHANFRKHVLRQPELNSLLEAHQIQDLGYLDNPRSKTGFSRYR